MTATKTPRRRHWVQPRLTRIVTSAARNSADPVLSDAPMAATEGS